MAYAEDAARLAKKRQLAQALIAQGAQPQGMQAGRTFVGPTPISGLASLAGIVAGGVMDRKLEKKEKGLADDRRKQLADMLRGMTGSPTAPMQGPTIARLPGTMSEEGWKGPVQDSAGLNAQPPSPMPPGAPQPSAPSASDPQRESMLAFLQGMPLAQQEALVGQQALTKLFPSAKEGFTLGKGERRYDGSGKVIAEGTADIKDPAAQIQEYQEAVKGGFKGSFFDYQKELKQAGASNVNVNTQQKYPNAFNEALGKSDAEQLAKYRDSANSSAQMVNTLDKLQELNPKVMSGGGANARAQVANWLSGWTGVDVVDPKVLSDTQTYNAVTSKAILDSLGGSLGAGVSNADVAFIKNTVPQLEYSAEARQQLIEFLRSKASNSIDLYKRAREYGETKGGLRGFEAFPVANPQAPAGNNKLTRNPDGSYTYKQ